MRDGRRPMRHRLVADLLDDGTTNLAKSLGRPTERHPTNLIRFRDPSVESQERRNFGASGTVKARDGLPAEGFE